MSIVKNLYINEAEYDLENGEKGKVAVFIYTDGKDYHEFIDANMNNPWMRVIISDINNMKQENFNDFILRRNRLDKLKNLKEISCQKSS